MAVDLAKQKAEQYKGKLTVHLVIASIFASIGGLIFGYVGIPGGIALREGNLDFLVFKIEYRADNPKTNYCNYNRGIDSGYIPFLYLPASAAALVASIVTRKYGRTKSIIISGISFCLGAVLNAVDGLHGAEVLYQLPGRIILGVGIGFGVQAIPLYLSEMAPMHIRGGVNSMFQLATSLGILTACLVNYAAQFSDNKKFHLFDGFRLPFALVAIPASLMVMGGILISETPNSLMQRGSKEKARKVLEKTRGTEDVEVELKDIADASEFASRVKHPFRSIFWKRNRPQLVMAILMPMFQSLTGLNALLYNAPMLFLNLGLGERAAFYSTAIFGAVLVSSALISVATVDRFGRRTLLISGGIPMILCQVIIAIILGVKLGDHQDLSTNLSILVMVVICIFVLAFGLSWGPLGWTIPSEIFSLETRSAGQSIAVVVNLLVTMVIADSFLPLMCALRYGVFLFYTGWIIVMIIFVYLFLPETKGVPIEEMSFVWGQHWFWKRILPAHPAVNGSSGNPGDLA